MAAHTLTILTSMIAKPELTEKDCEQMKYACGYAKGLDIPLIHHAVTDEGRLVDDWQTIYGLAQAKDGAALKAALIEMLPRYAYMKHYRMYEHVYDCYKLYVRYTFDGIFLHCSECAKEFPLLSCEEHERLASQSEYK